MTSAHGVMSGVEKSNEVRLTLEWYVSLFLCQVASAVKTPANSCLLCLQVHQMVLQYMDKCSLSAQEQAMLDLKEANKAEMAAATPAGPSSAPSRSPAQPQGTQRFS